MNNDSNTKESKMAPTHTTILVAELDSLKAENTKIEKYVQDVERNICRGKKRPEGFTATDILIFLHQQATIAIIKQCGELARLQALTGAKGADDGTNN